MAARRAVVEQLKTCGLSERRSCQLVRISRTGARYQSQRQDGELVARIGELAEAHPRYGYRRIGVLLRRAGEEVNHKRVWRLWQETGLCLPRRRPRPRRARSVQPMPELNAPNQVWCYDFLFDACSNGRRLKVLSIEDEYTRESLAIEVETSLTSRQVIAVLERLAAERGRPSAIRSDNGPEFIARSVKQWLAQRGIQAAFIEPGCPWQNGRSESFNGRLRDECLNLHWFRNLAEARVIIQSWQQHYNEQRLHSSLQYQTPSEFRQRAEALRVELRT